MGLNKIFHVLDDAMQRGQDVAMVTVVKAEGSTPRETGASMLVFPDGKIDGTVGGGKLEALCIEAAQDAIKWNQNQFKVFDLTEEAIGMACSGHTEVFIQVFKGEIDLLILGCGHVGQKIAELATFLGIPYAVADDREEFANAERFPNAQKILLCPPDQAIRPENLTPRTYIIIVTRGHALDQECLEAALQTSVPYIGMIGSMKKVPLTFERVQAKGLDPLHDPRVHSPIGLDLGGKSPAEIALSTLSEIVKIAHKRTGAHNRFHQDA